MKNERPSLDKVTSSGAKRLTICLILIHGSSQVSVGREKYALFSFIVGFQKNCRSFHVFVVVPQALLNTN